MRTHRPHLLLQVDDALDIVLLELRLVRHYVIIGAREVLLELVVESLTTDLDTDSEDYLNIDDLFFKGGLEDPKMPLAGLLDRVVLLILCCHDFI